MQNIRSSEYQGTSICTHLHLVCFAYAILTQVAITREGAQGKQKPTARLSTADLQNEVRRMVWDELSEHPLNSRERVLTSP